MLWLPASSVVLYLDKVRNARGLACRKILLEQPLPEAQVRQFAEGIERQVFGNALCFLTQDRTA